MTLISHSIQNIFVNVIKDIASQMMARITPVLKIEYQTVKKKIAAIEVIVLTISAFANKHIL
jgi:hypothetical protein